MFSRFHTALQFAVGVKVSEYGRQNYLTLALRAQLIAPKRLGRWCTMDQLEALLLQFLVPDNTARKQAEEVIKQLGKDPAIVPKLLEQVKGAHHAEVRQLAAVLLRKKIAGLWMKLTPEVQGNVKMVLLESIARETQ
jgi:hypothetical protein